jgi:CheY-like chemotaxis protein
MMVSMLLEDMLQDLGCIPIGPATGVEPALKLVDDANFDVGVLDVNLNGKETYDIADALTARAIPFAFATGYGIGRLPEKYVGIPTLRKPFQQYELERTLTEVLKGTQAQAQT